MKYLILDSENTGLFDYKKPADAEGQPRLASLAMIFVDENLAIEREQLFLVKPDGWVMPKEAEAINGLSTEYLMANGSPIRDALLAFALAIDAGYVVVAHNCQHDLKGIRAENRRAGLPDLFEQTPNICTMRGLVGTCKIPYANGRGGFKFPKLAEAMEHFKIPQDGAHTAMGDARSALALFRKGMELGVMPEPEVHHAKAGTAAGEAAGLGPAAPKGKPAAARPEKPAAITGSEEIPT